MSTEAVAHPIGVQSEVAAHARQIELALPARNVGLAGLGARWCFVGAVVVPTHQQVEAEAHRYPALPHLHARETAFGVPPGQACTLSKLTRARTTTWNPPRPVPTPIGFARHTHGVSLESQRTTLVCSPTALRANGPSALPISR